MRLWIACLLLILVFFLIVFFNVSQPVDGVLENEVRVLLIGKTGAGKSTTGNTILGYEAFKAETSASSITSQVQFNTKKRFGKNLLVVDTPGLFDTKLAKEDIKYEIMKCFGITSPGINAILLVVSIGRHTKEEANTVDFFLELFGAGIESYVIVVFTGKDTLINTTIEDYIQTLDDKSSLKTLLLKFEGRYVVMGNEGDPAEREKEVKQILQITDEINKRRGYTGFTNDDFMEAEIIIQENMKKRLEEYNILFWSPVTARHAERIEIAKSIKRKNKSIGDFLWKFAKIMSEVVNNYFSLLDTLIYKSNLNMKFVQTVLGNFW